MSDYGNFTVMAIYEDGTKICRSHQTGRIDFMAKGGASRKITLADLWALPGYLDVVKQDEIWRLAIEQGDVQRPVDQKAVLPDDLTGKST